MHKKYLAIIVPKVIKSVKAMLLASAVFFWLGGAADATLIKVTATGNITEIFNIVAAPFSIGDPFSYEVIVDDDPMLDQNPLPNYTVHYYTPNFLAGVAGSATLTFGSYTIPESNVETTVLAVANDTGTRDSIEIISDTTGAPLIDGIAPIAFSLNRQDFSQTALSDAVISPGLFESGGFGEVDAVYLRLDGVGTPCVGAKCAYGVIANITAEVLPSQVPEPLTSLLLITGLAGLGFARLRRLNA